MNDFIALEKILNDIILLSINPIEFDVEYLKEKFNINDPKVKDITLTVYDFFDFINMFNVPLKLFASNNNTNVKVQIRYDENGNLFFHNLNEDIELSNYEIQSIMELKLMSKI